MEKALGRGGAERRALTVMSHFLERLRELPHFEGPFGAFKLEAKNCDVLFASYPAGTAIKPHSHDTENVGVITRGELILIMDGTEARFEVETSEIEFWFKP